MSERLGALIKHGFICFEGRLGHRIPPTSRESEPGFEFVCHGLEAWPLFGELDESVMAIDFNGKADHVVGEQIEFECLDGSDAGP